MKKMALVLAAASFSMVVMQSCKKKEEDHKPPIQQTVAAQLRANEAYTLTLPKNKRNDEYVVVTQPAHSSVSEVGVDVSGNRIYKYTPALDYTGSDQVVVANPREEGPHQGKPKHHLFPHPHHHGDCDGGEEDHYIITINFTVDNSAAVSSH
jgi:hypothetical protein